MGSNKMLIFAAAVFLACVPYSQGMTYVVLMTSHVDDNQQCSTRFNILSEGIDDSYHVSCIAGLNTQMYLDGGKLLIGNYRINSVSVYVERPDSLVVLSGKRNNRTCLRKTFHGSRLVTPFKQNMSLKECDKIKKRVDKVTNKNTPVVKQDAITFPEGQDDECSGTIAIIGEEIRYVDDSADCLGVEGTNVMFLPHGFVVSSYSKQNPSEMLFSDTPKNMIRFKEDKSCENMVFTMEYGRWDVDYSKAMTVEDCNNAFTDMETYLGFTIYRYSTFRGSQCNQRILINGRHAAESLPVMPCDDANRVRAAYRAGWLLLGNPAEVETSVYSDWDSTLVLVTPTGCTRYIYEQQGRVDMRLLTAECEQIKYTMTSWWTEIDQGAPRGNVNEYTISRRQSYSNDQSGCMENIELEGNGIQDVIHARCETGARIRLTVIPNGFVLCDHHMRRICVLTDSPKTLIIVKEKRECDMTLYEDGKKIKSIASKEECEESRKKVAKAAELGLHVEI